MKVPLRTEEVAVEWGQWCDKCMLPARYTGTWRATIGPMFVDYVNLSECRDCGDGK